MDYFIKVIIIDSMGMLIAFIWVIYCIVQKREWFPDSLGDKGEIVVKVLALAAVVYIIVGSIVPEYKDLLYFYNNEFCYMEGVVQSHSDKADKEGHYVYIKDEESGEEIYIHFSYKDTIEQGDWLKIKYLPNSKEAILLEVNGKKIGARQAYMKGLNFMVAMGTILIVVCVLDIKAVLACTIETTGTYIKYNFAGNRRGEADFEPVFRYYIEGEEFQGGCVNRMYLSDIQKKFVPGQMYTIYVSNKDPGHFAISRKVPVGDILGILGGIWFILMGVC